MNSRRFAACIAALVFALVFSLGGLAEEPRIAPVLQPFVDSQSLAGAVTLVASADKVLSLEAVGYADIAAKKLLTTNSLFWIASQSKPITAAALMILVDEGKVNIDDPVGKYLPEFNQQWLAVEKDEQHVLLKKPQHPVTVKHLLTHTSGMPFSSMLEQPTLDQLRLKDAVRSYALTPLQSEPGTKFQYSNAGINTAARIIEVVTGKSYEAFMDERLFGPLGMKDTTFWPHDDQVGRVAKAYGPDDAKTGLKETPISQLTYPLTDPGRQPMPAGGLFSTAADVAIFCQMVLNDGEYQGKRILSPAAVKQMTSRQTAEPIKEAWGLGWSLGGDSFGHGGALSTNMNIYPQKKLITIFLVQHAGFPNNGGEAQGKFVQAATEAFGK